MTRRIVTRRGISPLLAFLLSFTTGACGLGYEVLWGRLVSQRVGGPLAAFTIVVSAFMLGLATGAWLIGRAGDRTGVPLRILGSLQCGVGLLGLGSITTSHVIPAILHALHRRPDDPVFLLVETLSVGALCLIPSVLMGGTLPLLLRAAAPASRGGRYCGLLSAANAAGAAAGALATGFFLLPALGLAASLRVVGSLSLLAGFLAIAASINERAPRTGPLSDRCPDPPRSLGGQGRRPRSRLPLLGMLLLTGIALTALEVVWTRLAYLSFGSSAQAASLVLAAVITGLLMGYLAGARLSARARMPDRWLPVFCLGAASAVAFSDPLLGRMPLLVTRLSGWIAMGSASTLLPWMPSALAFILVFLVAALPCLGIGAVFPLVCGIHLETSSFEKRRPFQSAAFGEASAAASLGNLIGAPLAYLALMAHAGSRRTLLASAFILTACVLLARPAPRARTGFAVMVALLLVAASSPGWSPELLSSGPFLYSPLYNAAAAEPDAPALAQIMRQRGEVLYLAEGARALVTVRHLPSGHLSMQVNGKTDASTGGDMKTQILTAQLPLLVRESMNGTTAARVLVIGLGSGVSLGSALTHPSETVDVVEISPEVVEAADLFRDVNHDALRDPRTRLVVGDARAWLLFRNRTYDIIASQPSNPWIAGEASLFTREFFSLARSRLARGGFMCQWLQGYGLRPEDFRSVVHTFADAFPHVTLWQESTAGGDFLLLGSNEPLAIDPTRLARAMSHPAVKQDLDRVELYLPADLLQLLVMDERGVRAFSAHAAIQTEDRLALEFSAPAALHEDTLGGIIEAIEPYRVDPAALAGSDRKLASELTRRAHALREERTWAAGMGVLRARRIPSDLFRAVSFMRAGMKQHARDLLDRIVEREPTRRMPRMLLAYLLMSRGSPLEASRQLATVARMEPEDPLVRLYLSRALYSAGHIDKALKQNLQATRLDARQAEAFSDRCAMLVALEDLPSADAACREALALDGGLAPAHANMALIHSRRGRWAVAETHYRTALELDPGLEDARFNLASLYERQGRAVEGLQVVRPLLATHLDDPDLFRLAARLSLKAGRPDAARTYMERSQRLGPGDRRSDDPERIPR
ncbi:MAG: fused MFS/spermidine synthase [Acidobacteriota bacterium]